MRLSASAEADLPDVAPVVLGESPAQEGGSQPEFPPRPARSHDVHPTLIPDDFAQRDAGDLAAVECEQLQRGVEALLLRLLQ